MTRPSLADIALRDALRVHLKGAGAPELMAEKDAASAADVPVLVAALRAVLDLHRPEAWRGTGVRVCAHCRPAWTGSNRATYPCDTVRAVTAHIDTTPTEKP